MVLPGIQALFGFQLIVVRCAMPAAHNDRRLERSARAAKL